MNKKFYISALTLFLFFSCSQARPKYPSHWWTDVPTEGAPSWEILPQEAKKGEVILSKRHELGKLSNFAPTPFVYRGKNYASVEGFWQMMLYPEGPKDSRAKKNGIRWKYTRAQVAQMTAFDAKAAGSLAEENMEKMGIDWVSFEGQRFPYRSTEKGRHYELIRDAMWEKVKQNRDVREVLLSTGSLYLKPDHQQELHAPPEWKYNEIWMVIRDELNSQEIMK